MSNPADLPALSPQSTNTLTRISSTTKPVSSPPTTSQRRPHPHRENPTLLDASRPLPSDTTGTYAHRPNFSLAEAEMTQGLSPVSSKDSAASSPGSGSSDGGGGGGGLLSRVITAESFEDEDEGGLGVQGMRMRGERDDGVDVGGVEGMGRLTKCASGGVVKNLLDEFCRLDGQ